MITPIFVTKKQAAIGFLCALFLFFVDFSDTLVKSIYAITQTSHQIIWFIIGMCISVWKVPNRCASLWWCGIGFAAFFAFVMMSFATTKYSRVTELGMGILGCSGILLMISNIKFVSCFEYIVGILAKYTMPIFLMHTIFAAGIRTILLKCRIDHIYAHVLFGITVSLLGPIITSIIMERCRLDFVIYPRKLLKTLMLDKEKD